jgi:predicted phosphate transport protein (TIGR00153 family)
MQYRNMKINMADINTILQALVPKDKRFYPLFEKSASSLCDMSSAMHDGLKGSDVERINMVDTIRAFEKQGDAITDAIVREANAIFLVPFDREDIHELAIVLDDVADYIYGASKRINLYKPKQIHPNMIAIAKLINEQCISLLKAVKELPEMYYSEEVQKCIAEIRNNEKHAEELRDQTLVQLFENDFDAIEKMKISEIISVLTKSADSAEVAASVIEGILVKVS